MKTGTKVAFGLGGGLVGSFLLYHHVRKWLAQRKLEKLRDQAIRGEVPPKDFLEAVVASGKTSTGASITADEIKLLPCSQIFPPSVIAALPGGADAVNQMRREGKCM